MGSSTRSSRSDLSRRQFLGRSAAALALLPAAPWRGAWAAPAGGTAPASPVPLGSILAGGDLGHRTAQNFARLQQSIYRPPLLWRQTNWQSWPGDFEGRALLAVVLLSRATGQPPDYLPAMVAAYPAQLNPQGYFGPPLDLNAINEQQLSGHGWYLRALCELYEYQQARPAAIPTQSAAQTLDQLRRIVRNLALPLRGKYAVYPIDPELRAHAAAPSNPGAVDGHLSGQHGSWAVSSDTGCAFIFLDGLAHAWVVLQAARAPEAPALKSLIDEAIARFAQIDLVAIKAQTHASLTATRALLRIYAQTGDPALLHAAQARYQLYRTTAMTAHYANTNWFGRPDSWTEPCAIIDSFMVATQLWQHTGNAAYLEDAHLIWFNGVGRGLRANGGFGTDTCPGFSSPFVRVRSYEAYFCCTMRGGEAHARAAQYLYFTREGELTIPFFSNSHATLNLGTESKPQPITLRQTTDYPYSSSVRIEVVDAGSERAPITLRLFAPSWTQNTPPLRVLKLNGKPVPWSLRNGFQTARVTPRNGDTIEFAAMVDVGPRSPVNSTSAGMASGYLLRMNGPLILGYAPPADPAATLRSPNPAEITLPLRASVDRTQPGSTDPPGAIRYITPSGDVLLTPINDLHDIPATPHDPCHRQILFRT